MAVTLAGFLKEIDKFGRATLLFPLSYDKDGKDSHNTESQLESIDKKISGYSPVIKGAYRVKIQKDTFCYKSGTQCTLKDLMGLMIIVEVDVKEYDYPGKAGWYLKLRSARNLN